jgi:hypothetical protein
LGISRTPSGQPERRTDSTLRDGLLPITEEVAMENQDSLEAEIVQVVQSFPGRSIRESWPSDRRWTFELTTALGELGRKHQFDVCASGWANRGSQCWPEWLYDLTWVEMKDGHVTGVPLILESEWSLHRNDIEPDFDKLLLGRADRRVMVFQQPDARHVNELVAYLRDCILRFNRTTTGDRYLFLGLDNTSHRFLYELFLAP